ncbi:MAG TPA: hypothetical protein VHQ90_16580 [Thermoanaerobaculia bacterium]|nr:hypothetical protein [Thermoanaerobaculia bacterium]
MPDDPKSRADSRLTGTIGTGKDLVALLRDLSVLILAVLLIAFPATFNSVLVKAGFEEGSLVGFKWKANLAESDNALKQAQATISDLQLKNDELVKTLAAINAKTTKPPSKELIVQLEHDNNQLKIASQRVQSSVAETISANAPLLEKAFPQAGTPPTAGFCYQEDRLVDGPGRYSVHCHSSQERCNKARGPNQKYKQSPCDYVDLSRAAWKPNPGGWMGAWYQFNREPFGDPFPRLK